MYIVARLLQIRTSGEFSSKPRGFVEHLLLLRRRDSATRAHVLLAIESALTRVVVDCFRAFGLCMLFHEGWTPLLLHDISY